MTKLICFYFIISLPLFLIFTTMISIIIRYYLRLYIKKYITKEIKFETIDYVIPFYKDIVCYYEFIKENKDKITERKLFLIEFAFSLCQAITILFPWILLIIFIVVIKIK